MTDRADLLSGLYWDVDAPYADENVALTVNAVLDQVRVALINPSADTVNAVASRAWAAGHYVSPSVVRAVLAAAGGDQ